MGLKVIEILELYFFYFDLILISNIFVILINLLRWNDVPRTSRIFCPKIAIFSQF